MSRMGEVGSVSLTPPPCDIYVGIFYLNSHSVRTPLPLSYPGEHYSPAVPVSTYPQFNQHLSAYLER
jgi:hypothetical protein